MITIKKALEESPLLIVVVWLLSILLASYITDLDRWALWENAPAIQKLIPYAVLLRVCLVLALSTPIIVLVARKLLKQTAQTKTTGTTPTTLPASSRPTPKEIIEALDSKPPATRQAFAKNYRGLSVIWYCTYEDAVDLGEGVYSISAAVDGWGCGFDVLIDVYPRFKTLTKGSPLKIEGTIEDAEQRNVLLQNVEFL